MIARGCMSKRTVVRDIRRYLKSKQGKAALTAYEKHCRKMLQQFREWMKIPREELYHPLGRV